MVIPDILWMIVFFSILITKLSFSIYFGPLMNLITYFYFYFINLVTVVIQEVKT